MVYCMNLIKKDALKLVQTYPIVPLTLKHINSLKYWGGIDF